MSVPMIMFDKVHVVFMHEIMLLLEFKLLVVVTWVYGNDAFDAILSRY